MEGLRRESSAFPSSCMEFALQYDFAHATQKDFRKQSFVGIAKSFEAV